MIGCSHAFELKSPVAKINKIEAICLFVCLFLLWVDCIAGNFKLHQEVLPGT